MKTSKFEPNLFTKFNEISPNLSNLRICGIDEAGRGALAGELVVAGCVFRDDCSDLGLMDSKKLSETKREKIFDELIERSQYLVVYFRNTIVDKIGLSECLKRALIVIKSHFKGCEFIYDGNCNYGVNTINTLIKADSKIAQVSAASIIAKVSRDRQMRRFDALYPDFGYVKHKGYGTKDHLRALNKFGPNTLTRQSFRIKTQNLLFEL